MKTQAQLLSAIRENLDEASARMWPDANIRRWINEGAADIARKAECLRSTTNITITAGTQTYSVTTRLVRTHRCEFRPTGDSAVYPLEYRDWMNMDDVWWTGQEQSESHTPSFYTTWGQPPLLSLVLYPTPSVGGVAKLFYYALPTELATDGTAAASNVEVPEGWHDLVEEYAMIQAYRKDADPRWENAKAIYDDHLKELVELSIRYSDQAGIVAAGGWGPFGIGPWIYDENFAG